MRWNSEVIQVLILHFANKILLAAVQDTLELFVADSLSEEAELIFWSSDYYELQGWVF